MYCKFHGFCGCGAFHEIIEVQSPYRLCKLSTTKIKPQIAPLGTKHKNFKLYGNQFHAGMVKFNDNDHT